MKYFKSIIAIVFLVSVNLSAQRIQMTTTEDEGMEAIKITTKAATYFFQTEAGGFSSILDKDGNDWVSWRDSGEDTYPASAAADYRGLPNMVHGTKNSGTTHPGFTNCTTKIIDNKTIESKSKDREWAFRYTFYDDCVKIEVTQKPDAQAHWFLFEGTVGGKYDPENELWGNDVDGLRTDKPDFQKTEGVTGKWQWAYFGDKDSERTFFVHQKNKDKLDDIFGYLGNTKEKSINSPDGMIVFGFGRGKQTKPLITDKSTFYVGFVEENIQNKRVLRRIKKVVR